MVYRGEEAHKGQTEAPSSARGNDLTKLYEL